MNKFLWEYDGGIVNLNNVFTIKVIQGYDEYRVDAVCPVISEKYQLDVTLYRGTLTECNEYLEKMKQKLRNLDYIIGDR